MEHYTEQANSKEQVNDVPHVEGRESISVT